MVWTKYDIKDASNWGKGGKMIYQQCKEPTQTKIHQTGCWHLHTTTYHWLKCVHQEWQGYPSKNELSNIDDKRYGTTTGTKWTVTYFQQISIESHCLGQLTYYYELLRENKCIVKHKMNRKTYLGSRWSRAPTIIPLPSGLSCPLLLVHVGAGLVDTFLLFRGTMVVAWSL